MPCLRCIASDGKLRFASLSIDNSTAVCLGVEGFLRTYKFWRNITIDGNISNESCITNVSTYCNIAPKFESSEKPSTPKKTAVDCCGINRTQTRHCKLAIKNSDRNN